MANRTRVVIEVARRGRDGAAGTHTHLWAHITDKPATFAPSAHTHTAANITDFDTEVSSNPDVAANTTARHTHSNAAVLNVTTASYTTALNTKLTGIATGAEVNVNADWNAASGDAQILNKPTLGTAASQDTGAFATAAQGTKADTAVQPAGLAGYSPTTHNHDAAYAPLVHSHAWANITSKPTTFPPSTHTHDDRYYTESEVDAKISAAGGFPGFGGNGTASTASRSDHTHAGVYEPAFASGTTAQYRRGDKTWQTLNKAAVGLANVDNTSDANKPVSTAQQAAINAAKMVPFVTAVAPWGEESTTSISASSYASASLGTITAPAGTYKITASGGITMRRSVGTGETYCRPVIASVTGLEPGHYGAMMTSPVFIPLQLTGTITIPSGGSVPVSIEYRGGGTTGTTYAYKGQLSGVLERVS